MRISCMQDIAGGLEVLAANDPRLAPVLARSGEVPLRLSTPDFAGLASIIVSQQVSRASASAIFGRLETLVKPLDAPTFLAANEELLREVGLSRPKQRALTNAAAAVDDGRLDLTGLCELPHDEAIASMTAVKGIGPWTAEIYLLFCAGHADIFPAGDLALQEAVRHALGLKERPADKQLREIAEIWSPWRGVAARLFWAYYRAIKDGRDGMPV